MRTYGGSASTDIVHTLGTYFSYARTIDPARQDGLERKHQLEYCLLVRG